MSIQTNPFADVPSNARGHLGLLFYEVVCRLIVHLQMRACNSGAPQANVFENFAFLSSYWDELQSRFPVVQQPESLLNVIATECEQREQDCEEWLPARGLRRQMSLHSESVSCLVLAGLIEEDARFGELFAALQLPLPHRRPTPGLVQSLGQSGRGAPDAWGLCGPLIDQGFLAVSNREAPRAEWELRVPAPVWAAMRGEYSGGMLAGVYYHPWGEFAAVDDLILTAEQRTRIGELARLLRQDNVKVAVMRGLDGSPRIEVLGTVARELGRDILVVAALAMQDEERLRMIGPLATLSNAVPVFDVELGTGETFQLPRLCGYEGPIGISLGREGGLAGPTAALSVTIELAPEDADQRFRYWRQELKEGSRDDLLCIAQAFTMGGGHIRKAAHIAASHAALDGRSKINAADVRAATRHLGQRLELLATRLPGGGDWSSLVVSAGTEEALRGLQTRCRQREQLSASLGKDLPGGITRGVRALFEGPSGTGKTLAARILAAELGLDVYRVDLAALMNKYIGETEKNLSRVLSRAEDLDIILLLDEGDSLMSRRTDVKSAHDRYANLETNYLLQRLETYLGIVVVTTNFGSAIDNGFRRRIDVIVKFHLPGPEERWRLWQLHLAGGHRVAPAELESIALRYELTGGQIRNAAVQATLLAMDDGRGVIAGSHVKEAIRSEYRKAGAAIPVEENMCKGEQESRLGGFLSAIS